MKHPLYAGSVSTVMLNGNCEISPDAVEGLYSHEAVNAAGSRSSRFTRYKIYDMAITEEAVFLTVLVEAARTDETTADASCFCSLNDAPSSRWISSGRAGVRS